LKGVSSNNITQNLEAINLKIDNLRPLKKFKFNLNYPKNLIIIGRKLDCINLEIEFLYFSVKKERSHVASIRNSVSSGILRIPLRIKSIIYR
jgi:hypothetical protein